MSILEIAAWLLKTIPCCVIRFDGYIPGMSQIFLRPFVDLVSFVDSLWLLSIKYVVTIGEIPISLKSEQVVHAMKISTFHLNFGS